MSTSKSKAVTERVKAMDWERVSQDLDGQGNAVIEHLLSSEEWETVADL